MTQPIRLSVRDIERATENGNTFFAQLAKEYLDTIRENDSIKGAALALILQSIPDGDKHTRIQNRHIKALADAIRNKDSAHE